MLFRSVESGKRQIVAALVDQFLHMCKLVQQISSCMQEIPRLDTDELVIEISPSIPRLLLPISVFVKTFEKKLQLLLHRSIRRVVDNRNTWKHTRILS